MSKNSDDAKHYHDIEIKDIKITSKFEYKKQHMDGIVLGHPSVLKIKLKNIGKRTFEGGYIEFGISHYAERPGITSSGSGTRKLSIPEIKPDEEKKVKMTMDFPNPDDHIEIRVSEIVSKNATLARIKGNRLLVPRISKIEEAKSEISKKIISHVSVILIIATLAATIAFGLWN